MFGAYLGGIETVLGSGQGEPLGMFGAYLGGIETHVLLAALSLDAGLEPT